MTAQGVLRLLLGVLLFSASSGPVFASGAGLRPAFGNTIVSTHPDGRKAKLWLNADHTYSAQGRNGKRSGGVWRTRSDKLCLSQKRPYPGLFKICRKIPSVSVGHSWSDTAFTGEPVTNAIVAGR